MENPNEIWFKGLLNIEKIVDKRLDSDGKVEYFVKWQEYSEEENNWEPSCNIGKEMIEDFEKKCLDKIVEMSKNNFFHYYENFVKTLTAKSCCFADL